MFLKLLNPKWRWLAKDNNGTICVYEYTPKKDSNCWVARGEFRVFNYTLFLVNFDFLSWEDDEPTNIQELLKEVENE